jgi:hypothetical protein
MAVSLLLAVALNVAASVELARGAIGALLFVAALRLYELSVRESGTPHVTDPTRRWVRLAFAALLIAAGANLGIATVEMLGVPVAVMQLSAVRHLVAQGFLLPLIVLMAARILPGYSGYMLHRARILAGLVWSLLLGGALRSGAEMIGGYSSGWSLLVALGGTQSAIAFTTFAVGLWRATGTASRCSTRQPRT